MDVVSKSLDSGIAYLSSDIVFLITIFVLFFIYTIYFGKSRVISLILAFYPAQFFYKSLPFLDSLIFLKGDKMIVLNKILIFGLILVLLSILFGRYVFHDSGYGSTKYFKTAGYSLAATIVLLIFAQSVINIDALHNFSSNVDVLFNAPDRVFWWNLAPLALLMFL